MTCSPDPAGCELMPCLGAPRALDRRAGRVGQDHFAAVVCGPQCARGFRRIAGGLNGTVPFFIPLRRYVDRELPAPEDFPLAVGRNLRDEMPGAGCTACCVPGRRWSWWTASTRCPRASGTRCGPGSPT